MTRIPATRAGWGSVSILLIGLLGSAAGGLTSFTVADRAFAEEVSVSTETPMAISKLWNWSDPAASEAVFRKEAIRAETSGDLTRALALETQVARALGLQGKFEAAQAALDSVELRLTEAETSSTTRVSEVEVRLRLERGRAFNSSGRGDAAKGPFADAFEIAVAKRLEDLAIDAAHMMAIVETGDAARVWFERGVELAEASLDPEARRWLGPLYNNYGWTLHDAGRFPEALAVFEKAVTWREQNSGPEQVRIARYCVARALRSLDRCLDALVILERLAAELEGAGTDDGYVHEELGECLLAIGREKEAKPEFRRAHELLSQDAWLQANEGDRLARLQSLGAP